MNTDTKRTIVLRCRVFDQKNTEPSSGCFRRHINSQATYLPVSEIPAWHGRAIVLEKWVQAKQRAFNKVYQKGCVFPPIQIQSVLALIVLQSQSINVFKPGSKNLFNAVRLRLVRMLARPRISTHYGYIPINKLSTSSKCKTKQKQTHELWAFNFFFFWIFRQIFPFFRQFWILECANKK